MWWEDLSDYRGILFLSMSQLHLTSTAMSAGLFLTSSSFAPPSFAAQIVVTVASSISATSISSEIAVADWPMT